MLLSFVLVLSLCAIIVGMSDDSYAPESGDSTEDTTVPVERVSVSPSSMNMLPEDVETLRATVYPSNATNSSVSWSCYPTGIVSLNVKIEEFTTDIRMIVIGNVFEWCLRNGEADFEGNMSRSLGKYLDSTLCEGKSEE